MINSTRRIALSGALMNSRLLAGTALAAACLAAVPAAGAASDNCPNAAIRDQQRAGRLPECRALEQVSAVHKGAGEIFIEWKGQELQYNVASSLDGNSVNYISAAAVPGQPSGPLSKSISARRGDSGWVSTGNDAAALGQSDMAVVQAVSDDGSKTLTFGKATLAAGAGPSARNWYVRDLVTGTYTAVTRAVPGGGPGGGGTAAVLGATPDFSHIVFQDQDPHVAEAIPTAGSTQVYDYSSGTVRLASVLPDGSPAQAGVTHQSGRVSRDGSRVFFVAADSNQIYVRIDGRVTRPVSVSQKTVPDPSPAGGQLSAISNDGRFAFFTTSDQLIDEDTDSDQNLYVYDTVTSELRRAPGGGHEVAGTSDDGRTAYLLDGSQLSVWRNGAVTPFGVTFDTWTRNRTTFRVSTDGAHFVFPSREGLTAYDNRGFQEVYVYDAVADRLACASCPADGRPPTADALLPPANDVVFPGTDIAAISRSMSADGRRVFFSTAERLVPADVNSAIDAYEYVNGQAHLLSTGRSSSNSIFLQASADGRDAFFSTRERLTASDKDDMVDIYDARVDGGFAQPEPTLPCVEDGCQGVVPAVPPSPVAPSALLAGVRDAPLLVRALAGKVSASAPRATTGTSAALRITVPSAGVVSVSGAAIGKASRAVAKGGTVTVRVSLTRRAKATLKRKRRATAAMVVRFTPVTGRASSKQLVVRFTPERKGGR
jgi:hypothetical protein